MAEPITGGSLKTNISDMDIGDYVICNYKASSGSIGTFSNLGGPVGTEISVSGDSSPNGSFYLIKVDGKPGYGSLLVSSSVVQHSVSWDTLNAGDYIQGKPVLLNGQNFIIRSLGGGNSYATADGKSATTDQGHGAWPIDNEWDEYIVRKDYGGDGPGADSIWHWNRVYTLCQETSIRYASNERTVRGHSKSSYFSETLSNNMNTIIGFRPCFEYQEGDPS